MNHVFECVKLHVYEAVTSLLYWYMFGNESTCSKIVYVHVLDL